MKFSSLLVLAAIVGTSTALESTCCNALESKGCTEPFPVQQSGTMTTAAGIKYVYCCADIPSTSIVNLTGSNPTCAGSETPPPAPTPTVDNTPTPTDIDNTSSVVTFGGSSSGMPDMAASCEELESQFQDCSCSVQCQDGETKCLEADSTGCSDAAKTFCVGQGSSVYLSCGHTETYSETSSSSETYSESHSSTTSNAESTCCKAFESKGCDAASAFPVRKGSILTGGEETIIWCCASTDSFNRQSDPACAGSDIPSAGFASSTSVAIGAAVAFLVMIFV